MKTLDTITDFVSYLTKKEHFIQSGQLLIASGEEDLLAYYLQNTNNADDHDYAFPDSASNDDKKVYALQDLWEDFDTGSISPDNTSDDNKKKYVFQDLWEDFDKSPLRKDQIEANRISYAWDTLIEGFNLHILNGTLDYKNHSSIAQGEQGMRILAREPRWRRRILSQLLIDLVKTTASSKTQTRLVAPRNSADPYYVFLFYPRLQERSVEIYRENRRNFLFAYCMATKLIHQEALDIVGIAIETEAERKLPCFADAIYLDVRYWTPELQKEAQALRESFGFYRSVAQPNAPRQKHPTGASAQKIGRNEACWCGSGKKYKKCCGK